MWERRRGDLSLFRGIFVVFFVFFLFFFTGVASDTNVKVDGGRGEVQNINKRARESLRYAMELAGNLSHGTVSPIHVLTGLIRNVNDFVFQSQLATVFSVDDFLYLNDSLTESLESRPKRRAKLDISLLSAPVLSLLQNADERREKEGGGGIESRHLFLALLQDSSITLLLQSFQMDSKQIAKKFEEREREFAGMEAEREREMCEAKGMLGKEELRISEFPNFLSVHVGGESSIWWKFLPLSLSLPPSISTELSDISYIFSSFVAESLPDNSILLIVNSPHDSLIYLTQHIWKIIQRRHSENRVTPEILKEIPRLRPSVIPLYVPHLMDDNFPYYQVAFYSDVTFPDGRFRYNGTDDGEFNMRDFIEANREKYKIFITHTPEQLNTTEVPYDLSWHGHYAPYAYGMVYQLVPLAEKRQPSWVSTYFRDNKERFKKLGEKMNSLSLTPDDITNRDLEIQTTYWNMIRQIHQVVISFASFSKTVEKKAFKFLFTFMQSIMEQNFLGYIPADMYYLQAMTLMNFIYPELGSEELPNREIFDENRRTVEEIIQKFKSHRNYATQPKVVKEVMNNFEEYLGITDRALLDVENMYEEKLGRQFEAFRQSQLH